MPRRRPRVERAIRKNDARALLKALRHHDMIADSRGRLFDLGEPVRAAAARGLAEIEVPDGRAVDQALIAALGDRAPHVRQAAATALAHRGVRRAVGALASASVEWSDPRYEPARLAALAALADLAGPVEMPALVQTLAKRAPSPETAGAILRTVVASKNEQTVAAAGVAAVALLVEGQPDETACAVEMLLVLGAPSVEPLLDVARDGSSARRRAIPVLARLGDRRAVFPLSDALHDRDVAVRRAAANALGELADPDAVPALRAAVRDDDHAVREAALSGLQRLAPAAEYSR